MNNKPFKLVQSVKKYNNYLWCGFIKFVEYQFLWISMLSWSTKFRVHLSDLSNNRQNPWPRICVSLKLSFPRIFMPTNINEITVYTVCIYVLQYISKTLWLLKIQFKYFSRTFQNKNIWSENVNYYYYICFFLILLCHFKNNMF